MKTHPLQILRAFSLVAVVVLVGGCATSPAGRSGYASGFLGDYSQLRAGQGSQARLVYLDPTADFGQYSRILIDPVQLWVSSESRSVLGKLSREDQQLLVDYLYTALVDTLDKDYLLVKEPGPGVLRIRAAITEGPGSQPVAGVVSTAVPFGLGISYGKSTGFTSLPETTTLMAEGEFLDSVTKQRVAAAVDRRRCDAQTWGDVKGVFDYWARRVQARLAELRRSGS